MFRQMHDSHVLDRSRKYSGKLFTGIGYSPNDEVKLGSSIEQKGDGQKSDALIARHILFNYDRPTSVWFGYSLVSKDAGTGVRV